MKHFFIVDQETWENFPKVHFSSSHWIETDTPGKLLVVAEFPHAPAHDFWESVPGVEPLPHLVFGNGPVQEAHIGHLQGCIGAKPGDNTLTLAQKAGKIHPAFRPERL